MKRKILIACGLAAAGLGMAGIFLPLLPATPFLLLALYCFARSSAKLHHWLLNNRICGPHLRNYLERLAVPLPTKISSLILLWASLGVSAFIIYKLWAALLLVAIGLVVSLHLLSLKTIPSQKRHTDCAPTMDGA